MLYILDILPNQNLSECQHGRLSLNSPVNTGQKCNINTTICIIISITCIQIKKHQDQSQDNQHRHQHSQQAFSHQHSWTNLISIQSIPQFLCL